jgi:predicted transcriptional regulator
MASAKKVVLELVKGLPDDSSLEDIQYRLYLRQKLERSLKAAAEGRTRTHAEVKKRLGNWLAK